MKLNQLFTNDEAVSPVIGVILMVAITVILAAVIGTFVLGLGDQVQSTAPSASFTFEQTTEGYDGSDADGGTATEYEAIEISHSGGDSVEYGRINVTVNGYPAYGLADPYTDNSDSDHSRLWAGSGTVSAGSSVTVRFYDSNPSGGTDYEQATMVTMTEGSAGNAFSNTDAAELESGDTVSVVWTSEDGAKSSTLGKRTVA